jgi:hypothetical protein
LAAHPHTVGGFVILGITIHNDELFMMVFFWLAFLIVICGCGAKQKTYPELADEKVQELLDKLVQSGEEWPITPF